MSGSTMSIPSEAVPSRDDDYSWSKITRATLQDNILGMKVKDMKQYHHAFVHKSALRDLPPGTRSYERLEFVGDSVINFVVGKYVFMKYDDKPEGFLTKVRTKIVSGQCLSSFAQKLGLQQYIVMNQKAIRSGWNNNTRIMEDVFEALVGAISLDMGLLAAKTFIINTIEQHVDFDELVMETNSKDALMRQTQAWGIPLPVYHIVPGCDKHLFCIEVYVNGFVCGHSINKNKKAGEQQAANIALKTLGINVDELTIESRIDAVKTY